MLYLALQPYSAPVANASLTVHVARAGGTDGSVSVDLYTSDASARAGIDYVATTRTVVFTNGERGYKSFQIPILFNLQAPSNVIHFNVGLSNFTGGATSGGSELVPAAIVYPPSLVQFSDAAFFAHENEANAAFTVTRTDTSYQTISVQFATFGVTAALDADYLATNGTLTFGPGETRKTVLIALSDDVVVDGTKIVGVSLSNASAGAALGTPSVAQITIIDDEPVPPLCLASGLSEAIATGGTYRFDCDPVILLTNRLVVRKDVTLDGAGHQVVVSGADVSGLFQVEPGAELTLIGLTLTRGRSTNAGAIYNLGTVNLLGCMIVNNKAMGVTGPAGADGFSAPNGIPAPGGSGVSGGRGGDAYGGAIVNGGLLRATNTSFAGNSAQGGSGGPGGKGGRGGSVIDQFGRCRGSGPGGSGGIGGDGGASDGGGLWNLGQAILVDVQWVGNGSVGGVGASGGLGGAECSGFFTGAVGASGTGGASRGAACFNAGSLVMLNSTLFVNVTRGGSGGMGAPGLGEFPPTVYVPSSGGLGGSAQGGAIYNLGTLYATNSTITSNQAVGGPGGLGGVYNALGCPARGGDGGLALGGALYNGGVVEGVNLTLWDNASQGGLVTNRSGPSCTFLPPQSIGTAGFATAATLVNFNRVALLNSILGGLASRNNCLGAIQDLGHNLCSDDSAGFSTLAGSLNNTDPLLGILANYGGPTPTLPLLWGSVAIDAGSDAHCPSTDQRGRSRPTLSHCDMGAFEYVPEQFRLLADLQFDAPRVRLRGVGPATQDFDLESTPDLVRWQRIASGTVSMSGWLQVDATNAGPWQFYRLRSPPGARQDH